MVVGELHYAYTELPGTFRCGQFFPPENNGGLYWKPHMIPTLFVLGAWRLIVGTDRSTNEEGVSDMHQPAIQRRRGCGLRPCRQNKRLASRKIVS